MSAPVDDLSQSQLDRAEHAHYTAFAPAVYAAESVSLLAGCCRALAQTTLLEPAWNHAGRIRAGGEELDELLAAAADFYSARGLPAVVATSALSSPADLGVRLAGRGWTPLFRHAWLFAPSALEPPVLPAGTVIRRATRRQDLEAFATVFCAAFAGGDPSFPADSYRAVFTRRPAATRDVEVGHCLALVERRPAACATIVQHGGVAGLYNLGVDPAYRRRGLGGFLTAWRVTEARAAGCDVIYLQTEDPSVERLHQRAGFRLGLELEAFRAPRSGTRGAASQH